MMAKIIIMEYLTIPDKNIGDTKMVSGSESDQEDRKLGFNL